MTITFFIDRSLGGEYISKALRKADELVIVHDDLFETDAPDEVWLSEAGQKQWVVLTKDKRIKHNILEKEAVYNAKCRMFVLVAKDVTGLQMADIIIRALYKIKRVLQKYDGPFIAKIWRDSKVDIWEDFQHTASK